MNIFSDKIFILLIILAFSRYIFKIKYIDCFDIIINHINTFRDDNNKFLILPFVIYFIIPFMVALQLASAKLISDNDIQMIIHITSALLIIFFIILPILTNLKSQMLNKKLDATTHIIIKSVIKETYYAIMFEIIISVLILLLCFVHIFSNQLGYLEIMLIYYFIFLLLINLFMVLKRISKLINKNIEL